MLVLTNLQDVMKVALGSELESGLKVKVWSYLGLTLQTELDQTVYNRVVRSDAYTATVRDQLRSEELGVRLVTLQRPNPKWTPRPYAHAEI